MKPIKFECPQCHETLAGDESSHGQRVKCPKCQTAMLVPQAPVRPGTQTARLIQEPAAATPLLLNEPDQETDIFKLSPVARAFPGQILLGVIFVGLGIGLAIRARDFSWLPPWVALISVSLGVLVLLLLWLRVKSCGYRLTTQRLFVRSGWLAKHVDELELYRVKDVTVDQGFVQRLLGYGTITVFSDDESTPETDLIRISRPTTVKEMIRTQYRAARRREGVRPTEFMP
jgi:membrane protein YdbS with pleckstrin-like domain